LRRAGIPVRLVPAPRHLSTACGTAISFGPSDDLASLVEERLRDAGVPFVTIHMVEDEPVTNGAERSLGEDHMRRRRESE